MEHKKLLISLATAVAASRMAKSVSLFGVDDILGAVGLTRRRSHALENLALVALGAGIGAGTALLLAPASGRETRQRIGDASSRLKQEASEAIREHKDEALRALSQVTNGAVSERA
ncbi:MAG: YtxH-like protein [Pseudomonadota bacterium]|jgi:hypothetical protein